jgi:hypothetical protein
MMSLLKVVPELRSIYFFVFILEIICCLQRRIHESSESRVKSCFSWFYHILKILLNGLTYDSRFLAAEHFTRFAYFPSPFQGLEKNVRNSCDFYSLHIAA